MKQMTKEMSAWAYRQSIRCAMFATIGKAKIAPPFTNFVRQNGGVITYLNFLSN